MLKFNTVPISYHVSSILLCSRNYTFPQNDSTGYLVISNKIDTIFSSDFVLSNLQSYREINNICSVLRTMTHHHPRLTTTLALFTSHTHARTLTSTPRKKTVDSVWKIRDSQSKKGINRDNNVTINVQI